MDETPKLTYLLLAAQEAERRKIARALHDELGQLLTALQLTLESARREDHSTACDAKLVESVAMVTQALQQVRDVSVDLWPTILDDLGLPPALRWLAERYMRSAALAIHVDVDPIPRLLVEIETACFRVVQEALTNIVRHAQARTVAVELRVAPQKIEVVVRDDGKGFDANEAWKRASGVSLGLFAMRERASLAGGEFEIASVPGSGTTIRAWFPVLEGQTP